MLESPKKRFMHNKEDVQWHLDLVTSQRFLKAVDAALLSMMHGQSGDANEANASGRYNQLSGATEFVRIFCSLSIMPEPVTQITTRNLNHKA
jgi:hypothetical protein